MEAVIAQKNPLVSIIVPVYNGADFLDHCIRSILAQTYENIELILIDDGSTDESGTICAAFAEKDARVRLIRQTNGGVGNAQNVGLNTMTGEYVTFCDNDDLMSPFLVERLLSILLEKGADMSQCRWKNVGVKEAWSVYQVDREQTLEFGAAIAFDSPAEKYQKVFSKSHRVAVKNGEFYYLSEPNWGKLYKASLWKDKRFPERVYTQDIYLAMEQYVRMEKVVTCLEPLYYWLQRSGSISHSGNYTFHRDYLNSAFHNALICEQKGILPKRSLYSMSSEIRQLQKVAKTQEEIDSVSFYQKRYKAYLHRLGLGQKISVHLGSGLRTIESKIYNLSVRKKP
jgi:glycosyltransferase involved in cell wall biosynthesis